MIEGIPDGWELVRIGPVCYGEWRLMESGSVKQWEFIKPSLGWAVVLRKIEKPKRYRPFANGDEFLSHPLNGEWIRLNSISLTKVSQFDEKRFWVNNDESCYTWEDGFNLLKFRDGTPFGIEVTD